MKSNNVEDAVLEVIDLLCGNLIGADSNAEAHLTYSNVGVEYEDEEVDGRLEIFSCHHRSYFVASLDETTAVNSSLPGQKPTTNGQSRPGTTNRARTASSAAGALGKNRSATMLTTTTSRRKREQQTENLQIAITELLNHFSHRNLDAIVRVTKMTLEKLRKRITSTMTYGRSQSTCTPAHPDRRVFV